MTRKRQPRSVIESVENSAIYPSITIAMPSVKDAVNIGESRLADVQVPSAPHQIPSVIPNRNSAVTHHAFSCSRIMPRYDHSQIGRVWFCRM
jgi:hypothetical protein